MTAQPAASTPKELSDRLEALRRSLRDSGKIGTESPENYELVSILNGVAALEAARWIESPYEEKWRKNVLKARTKLLILYQSYLKTHLPPRAQQLYRDSLKALYETANPKINPKPTTEPR